VLFDRATVLDAVCPHTAFVPAGELAFDASMALANQERAFPEIADLLSDLQYSLTGDDLSNQIDAFAA
jgi:hypothetical protein